jgi:hypothetical protein
MLLRNCWKNVLMYVRQFTYVNVLYSYLISLAATYIPITPNHHHHHHHHHQPINVPTAGAQCGLGGITPNRWSLVPLSKLNC